MVDLTVKGAALAAAAAGDFSGLPVYAPDVECAPRERIRAIQLEKLKAQVAWTYGRVAWYQRAHGRARVAPGDIRTLEDVRTLRSRTRACCARRSPTGFSPCRFPK